MRMSRKVAILRNYREDLNWSMKLYADQLEEGLADSEWVSHCVSPLGTRFSGSRLSGGSHLDRYATNLWRHPRALEKVDADIYHVVDHGNSNWVDALPEERTVVTCHDLILLKAASGEIPGFDKTPRVATALLRRNLARIKRAKRIICVSQATKADLLKHVEVKEERIRVVYQGIGFSEAEVSEAPGEQIIRERLKLDRPLLLAHVGHNMKYKNLEGIINALAALPRDLRKELIFLKLGNGFTRSQIDLIERNGLTSCVRLGGRLEQSDLIGVYRAANALIFPSFYEGFGWPPLEAMRCGLPVVCSDRGALGEIAGKAARIVDPESAESIAKGIADVLQNKEYRDQLIALGRERAKKFNWKETISKTLEVYEEALVD